MYNDQMEQEKKLRDRMTFFMYFRDTNLEWEWCFQEVFRKKYMLIMGFFYCFLLNLSTDLPNSTNEQSDGFKLGIYIRAALMAVVFLMFFVTFRDKNMLADYYSKEAKNPI
jgi:hypothetical protein